MSAMPQIEQDRSGMPFSGLSRDAVWSVQSNVSSDQGQAQVQVATSAFRGRIEIAGVLSLPEQPFTAFRRDGEWIIENQPNGDWPLISLFYSDSTSSIRDILVRHNGNTVNAFLLETRISYLLLRTGKLLLHLNQKHYPIGPLAPLSDSDKVTLYTSAQIIRKLKYIEKVFKTTFSLPDEVSWRDAFNIEVVFRGITEGQFTTRGGNVTFFNVPVSLIDLTQSPFNGPGSFSYKLIGPKINLLGEELPIGPVTVQLDKAQLANPRMVEPIRNGARQAVDLRFEVFDNQITYRFDTYVRSSRKQRLRKLKQFKQELAHEEPRELIDLIDESLQGDVTPDEANQIAMGWMLYNDLPDRYCPQEPEVDPSTDHWRVPIDLVYSTGEGGPVGELLIHKKTGLILSQTPIEEMRSKAMALAKNILHAG
jgi:hypothetical protein